MKSKVKVATWNMKSVAPKLTGELGTENLWKWADQNIDADIYIFTEAKIPKSGVPAGWEAIFVQGGVGARRPWGTIIASKTMHLRPIEFERNVMQESEYEEPHPATTLIVEALIEGTVWATVFGTYGLMLDEKSDFDELDRILLRLIDVLAGSESPVVVAGDFNLHPDHIRPYFQDLEMDDVLSVKGGFAPRADGLNGTRVWTHRNTNNPGAAVQELDFIFVTEELKGELLEVQAGIESFPSAFDVSDHAPVTATFEFESD